MGWLSAHNVRYPNRGLGTTVALKTYPAALPGGAHGLVAMGTVIWPLNGRPLLLRLSNARHGAAGQIAVRALNSPSVLRWDRLVS